MNNKNGLSNGREKKECVVPTSNWKTNPILKFNLIYNYFYRRRFIYPRILCADFVARYLTTNLNVIKIIIENKLKRGVPLILYLGEEKKNTNSVFSRLVRMILPFAAVSISIYCYVIFILM